MKHQVRVREKITSDIGAERRLKTEETERKQKRRHRNER